MVQSGTSIYFNNLTVWDQMNCIKYQRGYLVNCLIGRNLHGCAPEFLPGAPQLRSASAVYMDVLSIFLAITIWVPVPKYTGTGENCNIAIPVIVYPVIKTL